MTDVTIGLWKTCGGRWKVCQHLAAMGAISTTQLQWNFSDLPPPFAVPTHARGKRVLNFRIKLQPGGPHVQIRADLDVVVCVVERQRDCAKP